MYGVIRKSYHLVDGVLVCTVIVLVKPLTIFIWSNSNFFFIKKGWIQVYLKLGELIKGEGKKCFIVVHNETFVIRLFHDIPSWSLLMPRI